MPRPRKNEEYQEFINRCVEELIRNENRKPAQARVICESFWEESKKENKDENK